MAYNTSAECTVMLYSWTLAPGSRVRNGCGAVLDARDRTVGGITAAADGLYLTAVD